MPILSGLLLALFNFLLTVFMKFFDVRKAWILAIVVVSLGLLVGLYSAVTACIDACVPTLGGAGQLAQYVAMGWGLIWNGATAAAFSCWVAGFTAITVYVWKKKVLDQLVNML
ncbi:hypothetical protein AB4Z27_15525 [Cupriavidus sp. KB_39]|uniref:hypothetical protein n=1 Tax=Cupriavidus sp. KB_39 TaxID=3233036 RepID=UPI003F919505